MSDERVTYWIRSWDEYNPETGVLPEWKEQSYDPNDPQLVAMREEIEKRKREFRASLGF